MAQPGPSPLLQYLAVQQIADKELRAILRDAADEAEAMVTRLAEKAGIGAQIRIAQLNVMRNQLRKLQAQTYAQVHASLRAQMKTAASAAAQGEALIDDVLFNSVGIHIPALEAAHIAQAQSAVESLYAKAANGIPLSAQVYKTQALSNGWVDRAVNRGIALNKSAKEVAKSVAGLIRPDVPGGVSYAAQRLGRTELNNAFHRSQVTSAQRKPWINGMQWNISGSHPTPDECDDYAEEGHYPNGEPGVYRPEDVPMKPHPQCLCFVTSVTVSRDEFLNNLMDGQYSSYIDSTIYSSGIPTVC